MFVTVTFWYRDWYSNIQSSSSASSLISSLLTEADTSSHLSALPPTEVPQESLYKSDPTRKSKSGKTTFTRQADIEEVREDGGVSSVKCSVTLDV